MRKGKGVFCLSGIKKLYCLLLGFVGFLLSGITFLVILIQIFYKGNLLLTAFCAVSWMLYIFAAVRSFTLSR